MPTEKTEKKKKLVEGITSRDEDFARWYTDVVKKAQLCEYSSVKGCMILEPAGFAIWDAVREDLDHRFKEVGVQNCAMPLFIPESLLQKEKDHVEGFAPEVAWVEKGGYETLPERLCIRPTSETLFCDYYAGKIHSYRDLPKLLNQWCSVVRWEKTTRPFLRSREFWWQEGHTAHATALEAREFTLGILDIYTDFVEEDLAIPVIRGQKTDKEKFAGAIATFTLEALMHDGQALQCATSHDFGDGFARAFDIRYLDRENKLQYVHQTSWGLSTRIIGAIIMVHGDDEGLKLPPRIAPTQVVVCPIRQNDPGVMEEARRIVHELKDSSIRVKLDDSERSPGYKFADSEIRGIPIRIEIGPKDLEKGEAVLTRRDTHERMTARLKDISLTVNKLLEDIQLSMYQKAKDFLDGHTFEATDMEMMKRTLDQEKGLIKAMWCGKRECEERIKAETGASSRCIPFDEGHISDSCVCCGERAKKMVYWGRAY